MFVTNHWPTTDRINPLNRPTPTTYLFLSIIQLMLSINQHFKHLIQLYFNQIFRILVEFNRLIITKFAFYYGCGIGIKLKLSPHELSYRKPAFFIN